MTTIAPPPAEWAPHSAVWIGFPSHADLWVEDLEPAREEVVAFARAVHAEGRGEQVILVAADAEAGDTAMTMAPFAEVVVEPFGDIWLRDTAPILLSSEEARDFDFNGWGGKYDLEGDDTIGLRLGKSIGAKVGYCNWVLEGGAIDGDGTGTMVTTEQCLLNPNRNPTMTKADIERRLREDLGYTRVVWLGDGLLNDHTDGHVDNLARFVAPGVVACPISFGHNDPNAHVYDETARALAAMTDVRGAPLQVMRIASPGFIDDGTGRPAPASHMNFVIANGAVICPIYEELAGGFALEALRSLFPERQVIGLPSRAILTGGGSFHCITQQEPAVEPH